MPPRKPNSDSKSHSVDSGTSEPSSRPKQSSTISWRQELRHRVEVEPDFVALPAQEYSLRATVAKYPHGASMRLIARALTVTEEEAQRIYDQAIQKLRLAMD